MNTRNKRFFVPLIASLLLTALLVSGCQLCATPTPTYVEGIYSQSCLYSNQPGMAGFGYIQLYKYGVFTFFGTAQAVPPATIVSVYESIAVTWLVPDAAPYHTGNYVILGNRLYLNYPAMGNPPLSPAGTATGTYTPEKIVIINTDGSTGELVRYPPVNYQTLPCSPASTQTQLSVLPSNPGVLKPLSCLTGTWRVDTASYVSWMNGTSSKSPSVEFTKIDPPFYYKFNDDGSFAIYTEKVGLYFDAIDPNTGKSAGTFETVTTGAVKGTIAKLDPDPAYPGTSLITFNIMENTAKVIDIQFNGKPLTASPPNVTPLIDPSLFAKVGYTCEGDTLHLTPEAAGLPETGYTFTRDNTWTPTTP